jgi:hypothetical protein
VVVFINQDVKSVLERNSHKLNIFLYEPFKVGVCFLLKLAALASKKRFYKPNKQQRISPLMEKK